MRYDYKYGYIARGGRAGDVPDMVEFVFPTIEQEDRTRDPDYLSVNMSHRIAEEHGERRASPSRSYHSARALSALSSASRVPGSIIPLAASERNVSSSALHSLPSVPRSSVPSSPPPPTPARPPPQSGRLTRSGPGTVAHSPAQTASDNTEPIRYSSNSYIQGGVSQYVRTSYSYSTGSRFSNAPVPVPSYSWRKRVWQKLAVREPGPHPPKVTWSGRAIDAIRAKRFWRSIWPPDDEGPPPTRLGLHRTSGDYAAMRWQRRVPRLQAKGRALIRRQERAEERTSRARQAVSFKHSSYVFAKREGHPDRRARNPADEVQRREVAQGQRKLDFALSRAQRAA